MMRPLFKILQGLAATLGVVFVLVMASPFLPIPRAIQLFSVRSGSMEPTVPTGSLIFVRPAAGYANGDIITVRTGDEKTVTHRIIEVLNTDIGPAFRTKGDNNEEADPVEIALADIIGKTVLTVPYLGYPVAYAQTRTGFVTLILFPAVLIILSELVSIVREARRLLRKRRAHPEERTETLAKNITFSRPAALVSERSVQPRPFPAAPTLRRKIV